MAEQGAVARVCCSLKLEFQDRETAEKVYRSVELDNEGFVDASLADSAIVAEIGASSLSSLLHTLDDFLSCTSVAEKVVAKKR
jgi:tRNA threonylcarbamoyladenosine modification (KEOPS) complex  Pcc1 subunit